MEIDKLLQSRGILYYSDKGELTQAEIDEIDNVDIEPTIKSRSLCVMEATRRGGRF